MQPVIPSIRFPDLAAAVAFYVDVLGFEVARGEPADGNVAVTRGAARLMLEASGDFYSDAYDAAIRERLGTPGPHSLYIEEPELAAYAKRLEAAGVHVVDPIADRAWGQTELTVEDLAGNWLTFWSTASA